MRSLLTLLLAAPVVAQDVGPISPALRARFDLTEFYTQHVDIAGLPIVASWRVDPHALLEARYLVERMMNGRTDLLEALAANGVRLVIMAHDEWTTDVPEHADLTPARYWDRRARGLGATRARPAVSCGEENLLGFAGDPYGTENILIHEFAHAVHEMGLSKVDPTFDGHLQAAYEAALEAGLWESKYAATNRMEYWAEAVQSWYDTNRENEHDHNHVDTRAELVLYDPGVAALVEQVFGASEWRYEHPRERREREHLATHDPAAAPTFAWPAELLAAYRAHEEDQRKYVRADGESRLDFDRRAAAEGSVEAQLRLAARYARGRGVERDDARALHWREKAAESGYPPALGELGSMLQEGRGLPRDDARAVALFRRAADARCHRARYDLGSMLRDGRGVPAPDPVLAAMWLELAANARVADARAALAELRESLSPAERQRATRLARAW
jgi:hypothetical protein